MTRRLSVTAPLTSFSYPVLSPGATRAERNRTPAQASGS
jgi:hypothetical protein